MRAVRLRMCSKRAKSVRRPAFTGPASLSAPRPEGQDAGNSRAPHQHVAPEDSECPPATYLGPSPPFRAASSLGGRHRYVHPHRPAPWNVTFDCRASRGSYGTDFGLGGFDQGARTNPFPVRLREPLSHGPDLRPSAHKRPWQQPRIVSSASTLRVTPPSQAQDRSIVWQPGNGRGPDAAQFSASGLLREHRK